MVIGQHTTDCVTNLCCPQYGNWTPGLDSPHVVDDIQWQWLKLVMITMMMTMPIYKWVPAHARWCARKWAKRVLSRLNTLLMTQAKNRVNVGGDCDDDDDDKITKWKQEQGHYENYDKIDETKGVPGCYRYSTQMNIVYRYKNIQVCLRNNKILVGSSSILHELNRGWY